MIAKQTRKPCSGSIREFIQHIFHGPMNEQIRVILGGEFSVRGAFVDARDAGKTYGIRHIVLSGKEEMNEANALELLNDFALEFEFDPEDVTLVEHTKPRQNGDGSVRHYHIAVPELQANGRVLSSSWIRPRNEKICRAFEIRHGLEIVPGKFNRAVVRARPDLAEAMKEACEGELPVESYTTKTHQQMLRKGKKMPSIKSEIVSMWNGNISDFRMRLLDQGYSIDEGDKKPDAYVIRDIDGSLIGSASRILKIKQKDFAIMYREAMKELENVKIIHKKENIEQHSPDTCKTVREEGYRTSVATTTQDASTERSGGGKTDKGDYVVNRSGKRWNDGNTGNTDQTERRERSAIRDQNIAGNHLHTTRGNHSIASKIAVVRLSGVNVRQTATARFITPEEAREVWVLTSKPRKTDAEYTRLKNAYDRLNYFGFDKVFKTPQAATRYASKVLASLIINVIKDIAGVIKLALFGEIAPVNVEVLPTNINNDVHNIYKQAYNLLSRDAREKGCIPASYEDFMDVIETVDPMAQLIREYEEKTDVKHQKALTREQPSIKGF